MRFYRLQEEKYNPTKGILLKRLREYNKDELGSGIKDLGEGKCSYLSGKDFLTMDGLLQVNKGGVLNVYSNLNPFIYSLFTDYSDRLEIRKQFEDPVDLYVVHLPNLIELIRQEINKFSKSHGLGVPIDIFTDWIHYVAPNLGPIQNCGIQGNIGGLFNMENMEINDVFTKDHKFAYQSEYRISFDIPDLDMKEFPIERLDLKYCFDYLGKI